MYKNNKLVIGKNDEKEVFLEPSMLNRHGLITGASGSGKTTTVKVMAETISAAGIPIFYVDVKGDLASICEKGIENNNIEERISMLKLDNFTYQEFPTVFFDVFGKNGHPIRTTVDALGPRLLAKMLELTDAQEGILSIIFQISKDENFALYDLDDLRSLLSYVNENRSKYSSKYGTITSMSIGTILRELLVLEQDGGKCFFGKPEFDLEDLLATSDNDYGYVNVLDARELFKKPNLYASFLIWLLNSLFDNMPEVGDLDKPKLILFLDEAHLMFKDMPQSLTKQVTQIVKLIRSKGIGIYFISQSPSDIPNDILSQLGNKVQHVLRSYTPNDEKAIKAISNSFRTNENFNTVDAIQHLSTGEALISFLNEKGEPNIVEKVNILPPQSLIGTIPDTKRISIIENSRLYKKYEDVIDEESASEVINSIKEQKEEKNQEKAKKVSKETKKREKEQSRIIKRVTNKLIDKTTTKIVNSIWKDIFK